MIHTRKPSQTRPIDLGATVRWWLATAGVLVAALLPLGGAEASPRSGGQGKGLSNAFKSTVFLEVERVYHGYELSNTGSGFFISPDGYILTNTHVVADKVEMDIGRETVLVDLTVVTIKVVIAPRTPDELVLPAKVIAIDRARDLALLKVKYDTPHYLEVDLGNEVEMMDEVFVVGFPFGEMLTLDSRGKVSDEGGYPEVSVNGGRVASLRRDEDGRVVAIQTDAAINPGNSGGPMIDSDGDLVGVVYAEITGGTQIGFAISPKRIWDFVQSQRFTARFDPPFVAVDRRPVVLVVTPGALLTDADRGIVVLSGDDIPTRQFELKDSDPGWRAVLELPAPRLEKDAPSHYVIEVSLLDTSGHHVADHRYLLKHRGSTASTASATSQEAAPRIIKNEMTLNDYARKRSAERAAARGEPISSGGRAPRSGVDDQAREVPVETATPGADLTALRNRARASYKAGEYQLAIEILSQIVASDPDDDIARDYLELAQERLLLEGGAIEVDADGGKTKVTHAFVDVVFVSPLRNGKIRLWLDDSQLEPTIDFNVGKRSGGRVEHSYQVPLGSHTLKIELESSGPRGTATFEQEFEAGTHWTLRIDMPSAQGEAAFYLVQRSG